MDKYTRKILAHIESYNIYMAANTFTNEYNKSSKEINEYIEKNMLDDYNYEISRILKLTKVSESIISGMIFLVVGILVIFIFDYSTTLILNIIGWVLIIISIFVFISLKKEKEYNKSLDHIILNPSKYVNLDKSISITKNISETYTLKEKLDELEELKKQGILTEEEYVYKRKQIIEKY